MHHGGKTCPHCGTSISLQQYVRRGHCEAPRCLQRSGAAARDAERRERESEAEWQALCAAEAGRRGVPLVAVTPKLDAPLEPTPPEVRAGFLAHLDAALDAAFGGDRHGPDLSLPDDPPAIETAACAVCRGNCCTLGRNAHAFVGPGTLARQRADRPGITREALRAIYADALPARTTRGGCVFQGPMGCTLARGDRASICNTARCPSLRHLAALAAAHPGERVVVVTHDGDPERARTVRA